MGLETIAGVAVNSMLTVLLTLTAGGVPSDERTSVVVVVGAGGTQQYAKQFQEWSERFRAAAKQGGARFAIIGTTPAERTDRDLLREAIQENAKSAQGDFWLVFIGHGTFDGRTAKMNLRGPDITAAECRDWLAGITRPTIVVNCASSSGPFINALSAKGRVIVTATKSGSEQNFARFGDAFSRAIGDVTADLDKDGQTSLLEAYLSASQQTESYYKQRGQLATEHALIDDNGDGFGTPASWYQGLHATKKPKTAAATDGRRAHQIHLIASESERKMPPELRQQRDALELELFALRDQKSELAADEYDQQLETLLLKLAEIYDQLETSKQ